MTRGTLITLEGIDGAGKTTLADGLLGALRARGLATQLLREPGGVPAAEAIRSLVKDSELEIGARAEALLYAAARAQLVQERLIPLLDGGVLVLLDRFVDSSLAYQGAGRGLGVEAVAAVNRFATGGLVADRTLLLAIDPASARARSSQRDAPPDRIEREGADFFARLTSAYAALAAAEPARVRVIDGNLSPGRVLADAMDAIVDLLG
jgi:dTMP kinase